MKTAIRYFTKSKKGNTEKLANHISEAIHEKALTVSHDLNEKVDRLFLVNAMYAANIDKEVADFLFRNKDNIGDKEIPENVNVSVHSRALDSALPRHRRN